MLQMAPYYILAVLQMALAEAEKAVELDSGGEAASTRVMAIRRRLTLTLTLTMAIRRRVDA